MSKQLTIAALTFACSLLIATGASAATTFLIDLGDNATTGGFPGGASSWNTITAVANITGANYPVMADSNGLTTAGVTFHGTGTLTENPNSPATHFNNATGGPSWATTDGSLANTQAVQDSFYTTNGAQASFTLELTNLPGDLLTVDMFSSRNSTSAHGIFEYSTDNINWNGFSVLEKNGVPTVAAYWLGNDTSTVEYRSDVDGNTNARYMNASLTSPSGLLYIRGRDLSSGNFALLNALRITVDATPLPEVPEPSSCLLLGLGLVAMCRRLRRHRCD